MASIDETRDVTLVGQCLSGSEHAWSEFYSRFERLIRMVVGRRLHISGDDAEDVVHDVFISLMSALKNYDPSYSLQNFVCTIAERICVDHYRFSKAVKRNADTQSLDDEDSDLENRVIKYSSQILQEDALIHAQESEMVKLSLRLINTRCRELLRLRYYDEAPYSMIGQIQGITENTATVQTARCIRELRKIHQELVKSWNKK